MADIVDIDLSKDGDVCDATELNKIYQQAYHCASRKAVGLEKLLVLHLDCRWDANILATALSNNSVHLASADTLAKVSTFVAHNDNIIDIHFSPVDPNGLFTGSMDGTIRMWDLRSPMKHVLEMRGISK